MFFPEPKARSGASPFLRAVRDNTEASSSNKPRIPVQLTSFEGKSAEDMDQRIEDIFAVSSQDNGPHDLDKTLEQMTFRSGDDGTQIVLKRTGLTGRRYLERTVLQNGATTVLDLKFDRPGVVEGTQVEIDGNTVSGHELSFVRSDSEDRSYRDGRYVVASLTKSEAQEVMSDREWLFGQ